MKNFVLILLVAGAALPSFGRPPEKKSPACNDQMTFCWYGDEVEAWGNRWVSEDRNDMIVASIAVRCFQKAGICIRARATEVPRESKHIINNIEISRITHWDNQQITAQSENFDWEPCDRDSYIINRVDRTVIMISSPGPKADTKACADIPGKPRTVTYKLTQ